MPNSGDKLGSFAPAGERHGPPCRVPSAYEADVPVKSKRAAIASRETIRELAAREGLPTEKGGLAAAPFLVSTSRSAGLEIHAAHAAHAAATHRGRDAVDMQDLLLTNFSLFIYYLSSIKRLVILHIILSVA